MLSLFTAQLLLCCLLLCRCFCWLLLLLLLLHCCRLRCCWSCCCCCCCCCWCGSGQLNCLATFLLLTSRMLRRGLRLRLLISSGSLRQCAGRCCLDLA